MTQDSAAPTVLPEDPDAMTPSTMKVPLQQCRVHDPELIQFQLAAAAEGDGEPAQVQRRWTMLAHTGQIVNRWWGKLVLDLAGAQFRQRLALLMDHDTEKRLGYSTSVKRTERGLEASGKLLKNELAGLVLEESREGFPWEASLMAVPRRIQKLDVGENAEVNGQTVTGPAHIFREWLVRELTLTALGADDRTATEAFAQEGELDVELLMETKMTTNSPATPANTPTPATPAPAIDEAKLRNDAIAAERNRVAAILGAADASQTELANKLVKDGADEATAFRELLADAKRRLNDARSLMREGTEPLGGGNGSGRDGSGSNTESAADKLKAMPEGVEKWKAEFAASEQLRSEFVTEADYIATRKFDLANR